MIWISIHTPAQGVTGKRYKTDGNRTDFNPHSRTGSDHFKPGAQSLSRDFNPHSRTGSDWLVIQPFLFAPDFNPHSRTGSDVSRSLSRKRWKISIHTPAQGVTLSFLSLSFFDEISIHTPAQGVTTQNTQYVQNIIFQSTLPHRE